MPAGSGAKIEEHTPGARPNRRIGRSLTDGLHELAAALCVEPARFPPPVARSVRLVLFALVVWALTAVPAQSQLPPGVVFDDFDYASSDWVLSYDRQQTPLAGSVYGINPWSSTDGAVGAHRLWYRYLWQEHGNAAPGRTLAPGQIGLRFAIAPGRYRADGCPSASDADQIDYPQQIATGFAARRGTWAAGVRFGPMGPPARLATIQAFWLIAPYSGFVSGPGGASERVTEEIDHEVNNRFLGERQPFPFDATGVFRGQFPQHTDVAMYAPAGTASPPGDAILWPDGLGWTCRLDAGRRSERLGAAVCGRLLTNDAEPDDPNLGEPVEATLLIHVADPGVSFGLTARGTRGEISMASHALSPATDTPLMALFSQHLSTGIAGTPCTAEVTVDAPHAFDVDWFLYTPDADATEADIEALVAGARSGGTARVATVPGLRLERPAQPLWGPAAGYGLGRLTSPLTLDLHAPATMRPGETTRLVAFPPLRHGAFRLAWSTVAYRGGRTTSSDLPTDQAFAASFAFPTDADSVTIHVDLTEVDEAGEPVRNPIVQPIQGFTTVRRR